MLQTKIRSAADSYLSLVVEQGINWYPEHLVPLEMRASEIDEEEGLVAWKAVPSCVERANVAKVEDRLKVELSPQFVELLRYKHFMELHLGDMWFFAHPTLGWQDVLLGQVFNGHPREFLLDKGLLPFSGWSDFGLYCFRLDQRHSNGEYAVYQWDHSDPENFYFVAQTFDEAVAVAISR